MATSPSTRRRPRPAPAGPAPARPAVADAPGRGVVATWWYTAASVLIVQAAAALLLVASLVLPAGAPVRLAVAVMVAAAWLMLAAVLVADWRRHSALADEEPDDAGVRRRRRAVLIGTALALGGAAWWATGTPFAAALVVAQVCVLVRWAAGVGVRLTLLWTAILLVLRAVDPGGVLAAAPGTVGLTAVAVILPAVSIASLWWWDVVHELDRARAAEGRLAAAQERLRVANDVHDLQGHHLQVIALQLELADRLLPADPDAAAVQIRAARRCVDEARQGTRDLALRFRGVPLSNELQNAADLLRAAGVRVELALPDDADDAPADVLGPVVREATTNILKHGGGRWARLALRRTANGWEYRAENDADGRARPDAGAGLASIADRVGGVGGHAEPALREDGFALRVVVPLVAEPRP